MIDVVRASFLDELEKISESTKPKSRKAEIASGAAGLGGWLGGTALGQYSGVKLLERKKGEKGFSPELVEKIRQISPVPVKEHLLAEARGGGVYTPKGVTPLKEKLLGKIPGGREAVKGIGPGAQILVGREVPPSILAHEIGHAQFGKGIPGKVMQSGVAQGVFKPGGLISAGAGYLAGKKIEDPVTGAAVAGGVPLAIVAPTLGSEAIASHKAVKNLRAAGASPAQITAAKKSLRAAFGTYGGLALAGLGMGLGAYGLGRRARRKLKEKEKKKEGSAPSRDDMRDKKSVDVQAAGKLMKGHTTGSAPEDDYTKMAFRVAAIIKRAQGELDKKPGDVPSDEGVAKKVERVASRTVGSSGGGQGTAPPDREYVNAGRFYGTYVDPKNVSSAVHQDSIYAPSTSNPLDKNASALLGRWRSGLDPSVREALT